LLRIGWASGASLNNEEPIDCWLGQLLRFECLKCMRVKQGKTVWLNGRFDLIERISRNDISGLDSKKLKGEHKLYRIRKGSVRIIFVREDTENVILSIEKRSDKTYKDL